MLTRRLVQFLSVGVIAGVLTLSRSADASMCPEGVDCEAPASCDSGGPGSTSCNQSYSTPAPPNPSNCTSPTCTGNQYACCGKNYQEVAACECR